MTRDSKIDAMKGILSIANINLEENEINFILESSEMLKFKKEKLSLTTVKKLKKKHNIK